MAPTPNIDPQSIKQAVEDLSGYTFELEIVRRLEKYKGYGFFVEPNYSFEDHDTGEARELDFHAIMAEAISTGRSEYSFMILLGSCKDNKNPYVFFTRNAPLSGITLNSDIPIAGYPLEIYDESGESEALEWYLQLHKFLHIAKTDIISSQFCEIIWKTNKWTIQSEPIFKNTFIPLIKAMSREIEGYNKKRIPDKDEESSDFQIYFPLLVLKGPMFEYYVPPTGDNELRQVEDVLFIRHYESRNVKCCYAIDIIHEGYLETYLDIVSKEFNRFVNLVRRNRKSVLGSIKKIAEIEDKKRKESENEKG